MKLSTRDLAATPTANFVVKYKSAQTDKVLQGTRWPVSFPSGSMGLMCGGCS